MASMVADTAVAQPEPLSCCERGLDLADGEWPEVEVGDSSGQRLVKSPYVSLPMTGDFTPGIVAPRRLSAVPGR